MSDDEELGMRLEVLQSRKGSHVTVAMLELALDKLKEDNYLTKNYLFTSEEVASWLSTKFSEITKMPLLIKEVQNKLRLSLEGSRIRVSGGIRRVGKVSVTPREFFYTIPGGSFDALYKPIYLPDEK